MESAIEWVVGERVGARQRCRANRGPTFISEPPLTAPPLTAFNKFVANSKIARLEKRALAPNFFAPLREIFIAGKKGGGEEEK